MLETIRTDITLLDEISQLEFFVGYVGRRAADMLKAPTYVPGGVKKKAKAKSKGVVKAKGSLQTKLKGLDDKTLELLRKAGVKV